MQSELHELRERSADLGDRLGDDEALDVNAAILDLVPGDQIATNRLGIGLINCGRAAEAVDVLEAGLRLHPRAPFMRTRLEQARKDAARDAGEPAPTSSAARRLNGPVGAWDDFEVAELVEAALEGPGRDASIRLCAESIRMAESIDPQRSAVIPIKSGRRFRTIGGIFTGVGPWQETLTIAVPVSQIALIERVSEVGGYTFEPAKAVPCLQLAIPRTELEPLYEQLVPAHREHLMLSIEAGPPTHMNKHHPGLRAYLLEQADAL